MKKIKFMIVPLVIVLLLFGAYIIYGNTMINIDDEKSLSDFLSANKDNPISILDFEKHENYVGILYTDPVNENNDMVHFVYLRKHNLYKNRYVIKGGGKGNSTGADSTKAYDDEKDAKPLFFIYSQASEDNLCSVFEYNFLTGEIVKKLDELEVPQNSYVIAKSYDLEDELYNDIMVFDGSVSFEEASKYFQW